MTHLWQQRTALEALFSAWRADLVGQAVTRVATGPGWISIALGDRPSTFALLICRPGASLLWDDAHLPPDAIRTALGRSHKPPSWRRRLIGYRFEDAALFPEDRVVLLRFQAPGTDEKTALLHQLFGSRGNIVLLDRQDRLLWSMYRSPHPVLTRPLPDSAACRPESPPETSSVQDARRRFREEGLSLLRIRLTDELLQQISTRLRQADRNSRRLVENLERDVARTGRGDEHRCAAEALAIHLPEIPRGAEQVTLPNPHGADELQISLDPALTPAANLDHYFRLARKADRGREVVARRLSEARNVLEQLIEMQSEFATIAAEEPERLERLLAWRDRNRELLGITARRPAPTGGRPAATEPSRPFRRYRLDGRWEVWVGRNNRENDEMTHRTAAPNDLWMHAQGVSGSHVVLRTGGKPEAVPKQVVEKAASLAALHSKARHSALVPVMVTLRKYVRKPRKSPPGTASCVREKTVFVAPGVPAGAESI